MGSSSNILAGGLSHWVSEWLSKQGLPNEYLVTPLAGDGSPRPFYRIQAGSQTFVLLSDPPWTLSKDYPAHQAYLEQLGLPVPRFLSADPKLGALLMEDLGDELLQGRLLQQPEQKSDWLKQTVCLLAQLHGSTFPVPPQIPAATRRFDAAKYFEEMLFTLEHLHEKLLGLPALSPVEREPIRSFCQTLEKFQPLVFCHRDYHTRNLLVHEGTLRLIDFQDARLGPPEYDLASLFYDAYIPLDAKQRQGLLKNYRQTMSHYPLFQKIDWDGMPDRLEKVAFQRVVKAAGSFASFFTRFGKRTHLPYLLPALEMAERLQCDQGLAVPALPISLWIRKTEEALK